jgi:hypothetical protein
MMTTLHRHHWGWVGIYPMSSCSWQCHCGPMPDGVAGKVGQEVAVVPSVPGDTEEDPPHKQLLVGMSVILYGVGLRDPPLCKQWLMAVGVKGGGL